MKILNLIRCSFLCFHNHEEITITDITEDNKIIWEKTGKIVCCNPNLEKHEYIEKEYTNSFPDFCPLEELI